MPLPINQAPAISGHSPQNQWPYKSTPFLFGLVGATSWDNSKVQSVQLPEHLIKACVRAQICCGKYLVCSPRSSNIGNRLLEVLGIQLKLFNIHRTFPSHKRLFIVEKYSLDF